LSQAIFDIAEVSYCLEGEGIWICDGKEFDFKPGYVIYVSSAEVRIIKNTSTVPLKYLCIVDPAWQPEYETVL
jgi:mannose-6-phosphate isomerase-like protein (cupin superfamily)